MAVAHVNCSSWCVQVFAVQQERAALWRCLHGSLSPTGSLRPDAIDSELLVYIWIRLRRTVARLPTCKTGDTLTALGEISSGQSDDYTPATLQSSCLLDP